MIDPNKVAKEFISSKYSMCLGYSISGSYATKTAHESSDLDIIVLLKEVNNSFIEKVEYLDGLKIEVVCLSLSKLSIEIWSNILKNDGSLIVLFARSVILKDHNNLLFSLQQFAKYYAYKFLPYFDKKKFNSIINSIESLKEDLSNEKLGVIEKYFTKTELVHTLVVLLLLSSGMYIGKAKHTASSLKRILPEFYSELAGLLSNENYSSKKLVEFVNSKMNFLGYTFKNYTTKTHFLNSSYPIIQIEIINIESESIKKQVLSNILEKFKDIKFSNYYIITSLGKINIITNKDENPVFFNNISIAKENILIACLPYKLNQDQLAITYKFQKAFFADNQILMVFERTLFNYFEKFTLPQELLSANFSMLDVDSEHAYLPLLFIIKTIENLKLDEAQETEFINLLYEYWLPSMYDLDDNDSLEIILHKRTEAIFNNRNNARQAMLRNKFNLHSRIFKNDEQKLDEFIQNDFRDLMLFINNNKGKYLIVDPLLSYFKLNNFPKNNELFVTIKFIEYILAFHNIDNLAVLPEFLKQRNKTKKNFKQK